MNLLDNIATKLIESRRAVGLEAVAGPEGYVFQLVILKKSGSKITIESKQERIAGTEALKKYLKPGIPVYLAVSGRGLVHKKVQAAVSDDARTLLPKVLPNATPADFYVQRVNGISGQAFVSIVRRATLDPLLEELKPIGDIVSCALGALPVTGIAALLQKEDYQFSIVVSGQQLTFSGGELSEVQPSEMTNNDQVEIGGEKLPVALLNAFSTAFGHFSGKTIAAGIELLQQGAEAFRQKRVFRLIGASTLVVVLVLLLGNYLFFQHYWEKKAALETQLALSGGELQRYQVMEKSLRGKQQFLESSGLLHASRTSFYADQLALDLPAAITLTRLNVAPQQHLNTTDSVAFTPGIALVEGFCRQSLELNNWIGQLKEKQWVKNVSLQSYNQEKAQEQGEFVVQIEIN